MIEAATAVAAAMAAAFGLAEFSAVAAAKPISNAQAEQLFATTCGWCHQNGGREAGKGPKLAGTKRSDAFIVNRIKNGKEGQMPAFEGALTDDQIKGIIHYIHSLKGG
jgi:mono/diheme cytochrome c family protein